MSIIIKNIKGLIQILDKSTERVSGKDMAKLSSLSNAWLLIENGLIADFGEMSQMPSLQNVEVIDATGKFVLPTWVDSHTHLVFAGSRETEFVDKIKGLSYEEIGARGGGIHNSAALLRQTSEEDLLEQSLKRAKEIIATGTGVVEIKSGYGLTTDAEMKMLRVAKKIAELTDLEVKTTFLGAHAIPRDKKREEYIQQIKYEMLPAVAAAKLADYCDVFCEKGFFTAEETEDICREALKYGLKPRIHANQLYNSGGIEVGVKLGALSVDHLEVAGDKEIAILKDSQVMPTLLPGAAWFLNAPFPPARKMIEAGLPVAIASDFNPGSSPTGNMPLLLAMSCVKMKMLPQEVIHAATINTASALELSHKYGSITKGKVANLIITKAIPTVDYMFYMFGTNHIDEVILKGKRQVE